MLTHKLNEPWTAHVVSRMHRYGIKQQELAETCHYSPSYLSDVLNCRKKFRSEKSYMDTKSRIVGTLENMIEEIIETEGLNG